MYLDGGFTQEKYAALLTAALDGKPDAMYELGMTWCIIGRQTNDEKRISDGMEYLQKASDRGYAAASTYIGTIYQDGKFGFASDMSKAVAYYKRGAELGDPMGMSNYGIALQRGDGGLAQDNELAFFWIKKAADADESLGVAQYNVALACHAGRGVAVDRVMAKQYFQRAAKAGVGMAAIWLYSEDYKE